MSASSVIVYANIALCSATVILAFCDTPATPCNFHGYEFKSFACKSFGNNSSSFAYKPQHSGVIQLENTSSCETFVEVEKQEIKWKVCVNNCCCYLLLIVHDYSNGHISDLIEWFNHIFFLFCKHKSVSFKISVYGKSPLNGYFSLFKYYAISL